MQSSLYKALADYLPSYSFHTHSFLACYSHILSLSHGHYPCFLPLYKEQFGVSKVSIAPTASAEGLLIEPRKL